MIEKPRIGRSTYLPYMSGLAWLVLVRRGTLYIETCRYHRLIFMVLQNIRRRQSRPVHFCVLATRAVTCRGYHGHAVERVAPLELRDQYHRHDPVRMTELTLQLCGAERCASSPNIPAPSFVSVTANSIPTSPVTFLPAEALKVAPLRAPRPDSEDVWSLIYGTEAGDTQRDVWWVLAESVGRWDRRWG